MGRVTLMRWEYAQSAAADECAVKVAKMMSEMQQVVLQRDRRQRCR